MIVRKVRRRVVLLLAAGAIMASVAAGLALARGTAAPIGSGVVVIDTNLANQDSAAAGTGMVLTSGELLTNNHVISGATTIKVLNAATGRIYKARVLGYNRTADVALLQLQGASDLKPVSISATKAALGETVTALGNAGGDGRITRARGTVTGLGKSITAAGDQGGSEQLTGLIETNTALRPGDSGGPLVDGSGRVVGMDTAASSRLGFESVSSTDAYAIPIAKALTIARAISAGRASATIHVGATAFLGIEAQAVEGSQSGAAIADVVSGGPAASAGLAAGDVITAIDGRTVSSPAAVSAVLLKKKPGATVTVDYVDLAGGGHAAIVMLGSGPPQ